jgi:hypothetical protein
MTDEDMTTVLRSRSRKQQKEYTSRRTVSPRRPMTTIFRKPEMQIEDKMEASGFLLIPLKAACIFPRLPQKQ